MGAEDLRLYEAAMKLPDSDRAELAAALADSVGDGTSQEEVLASWVTEVKRRIEEHRAGRSQMVPFEDVFAEIEELITNAEQAAKT
jgi:putative addiction module component (TIGR02574 family)